MNLRSKINTIIFILTFGVAYSAAWTVESLGAYLAEPLFSISLAMFVLAIVATFLINWIIGDSFGRILEKTRKIVVLSGVKLKLGENDDDIKDLESALDSMHKKLKSGGHGHLAKEKEIDQAKTDFVALASHQLRTPLSIIKWYVDFMLEEEAGPLNKDQKRYLREVYQSNEHLIELVNALLDVSRIDVGTFSIKPEPSNLIDITQKALADMEKYIREKKIKFFFNYEKDLPIINLDPKLTQVLLENLLSNSIKYTPIGGAVGIEIKTVKDNILIEVYDTGPGIPKQQEPKIFTKMFRADNVKKIDSGGTGLGLYIVKAIVEKSGGKIWFESQEKNIENADILISSQGEIERSTTFYISIPLKGMIKKEGAKELTGLRG